MKDVKKITINCLNIFNIFIVLLLKNAGGGASLMACIVGLPSPPSPRNVGIGAEVIRARMVSAESIMSLGAFGKC